MKNKLAAAGLAAGLLGGAAAGIAWGVPGLAGAQSDPTTTTVPATDPATGDPATGDPATDPSAGEARRAAWMGEALAPLVSAGTITQAQADAVIEALQAAKPEARGRHGLHGVVRIGIETAADALGVTNDELRDALRDGKSIADVAGEKGVDVQTVITALETEAKDRIADAVTDGRITQAQADERLATLTDDITRIVNAERPFGGGRGGRGGAADDSEDSSTTTTTTA